MLLLACGGCEATAVGAVDNDDESDNDDDVESAAGHATLALLSAVLADVVVVDIFAQVSCECLSLARLLLWVGDDLLLRGVTHTLAGGVLLSSLSTAACRQHERKHDTHTRRARGMC